MASLNKAILIGNIGKDFELRKTAAGSSIANLTLATTRRYKDGQGQPCKPHRKRRILPSLRQIPKRRIGVRLVKAHTAFSLRGFFVCVAVFLHGRIAQGVFGLADFLYVGTPTCTVCPPQLALEQAGF